MIQRRTTLSLTTPRSPPISAPHRSWHPPHMGGGIGWLRSNAESFFFPPKKYQSKKLRNLSQSRLPSRPSNSTPFHRNASFSWGCLASSCALKEYPNQSFIEQFRRRNLTRKCRVPTVRGANPQFASAVRCFFSGVESPGAAVPGTKGHRKLSLVERNASLSLKTHP